MTEKPDATLLAVGDIIAEERRARIAAEREIAAELARLHQRLEDLRGFIREGKDGKDGTNGKDGEPGRPGKSAYAGQARGLHDPLAQYKAMDVAVSNGCEWRAVRDDPGPLPGDGWTLGAKQGRKGDKGERGPPGQAGRDGAGIKDIFIDRGVLVIELTDGRRHEFMLEAAA